ncbi:MAG TPA: hypothetical protein ENH82_17985 [bacterium]|nr:hypothetical protein [bacterium]
MSIDLKTISKKVVSLFSDQNNKQMGIDGNGLYVEQSSRTAFGESLVGQLHPIFQGSFEYTVDNTDLNTNTSVNGGTITQASAMAVLSTWTTTASTQLLQTKQHAKYRAGLGAVNRFTMLSPLSLAGTEQYIGLADEVGSSAAFKNGYMIGFDGTTFGYHRFQNDVKITKALADWDDPLDGEGASGMTIDHTKLNVFFVQFKYLGGGAIKIWIEDEATGKEIVVHTEKYANLNTSPSVHNPNFFHTMWVNNGSTTTDIVLKGASYAFFIEGKTKLIELHQPSNSSDLVTANTVTTEVPILTIRNKAAYAGKTNFIDILLKHVTAASEANSANNLASVRMVKNATLGGASYADINTTNSVVDIDVAANTITGGQAFLPLPLAGKNGSDSESLAHLELILNPGDTLTIAGKSANAATIEAEILWRELF